MTENALNSLTLISVLRPGDSGSWVVDAKTSRLYGHIVSVDAFGEAQVIPIHSTLQSIRDQLKVERAFLPLGQEIDRLKATLEKPSSSILPISRLSEPASVMKSAERSEKRPDTMFDLRERLLNISLGDVDISKDNQKNEHGFDRLYQCDIFVSFERVG